MSPTANRDLIMEIIYHNVTALTGLVEMFRSEWDQGSTTSEHTSPNESHTARSAWYCQTERRASGLMQWHIKTNSGKPASEDCKHAILFVTQVGIDTQQMFIEESRIRSLIQLAGSVWHHRMHLKKNVLTYCLQLKLNCTFGSRAYAIFLSHSGVEIKGLLSITWLNTGCCLRLFIPWCYKILSNPIKWRRTSLRVGLTDLHPDLIQNE